MKSSSLDLVVLILLVVGGLNWGLVGLFDYNLVTELLGSYETVVKVVYTLVGLSALYTLVMHVKRNS